MTDFVHTIPADTDWREGGFVYLDCRAQQNPKAFSVFRDFFAANSDFKLVVEIGTSSGGLSLLLKDLCDGIGAKFVTYEINEGLRDELSQRFGFVSRNIDMRVCDIFQPENIRALVSAIQEPGRVLLLCDGGNKVREFNLFAPYLKPQDVIMAHDYAPNGDVFHAEYVDKIWNWHEIDDASTAEVTVAANLENFYPAFPQVAWLCCIKKS
jgi:hypothetical protein